MSYRRVRSLVAGAVVLAVGGLGWYFFAPSQIGGSTGYVITHGISMEPLIHTGDLVLVRPADHYRVGQVVAYHSTVLHTVALHRIIAISDGHYTFKGDNNNFVDPTRPTKALLIGAMWLHIPRGGIVLQWIHKPWVAAMLTGGVALLLLFGGDQQRRRRRRRHGGDAQPRAKARVPVANRNLMAASLVGCVLFAALTVVASIRHTSGTATLATPYTQRVAFGYQGRAHPGPVYPNGVVTTGEQIYLPLVHHLTLTATYELTTSASFQLHGSVRIRGTMSNTSGWSRSFWLGPPAQISGDRAVASAQISLPKLQSLSRRVTSQIGSDAGGYTLAVVPKLSLHGMVGGQPLASAGQPSLSLALGSAQLLSDTPSPPQTGSSAISGLVHTTTGNVTLTQTATGKIAGVPVRTLRWIGLGGLAFFGLLTLVFGLRERGRDSDPVEHINHRYKHLIVPVSSVATDPEHPPIEVRTIEALAQLAERSERLILHDHQADVDNYMIDDQGTLFRFQALRIRDTNGNGNGNGYHVHAPEVDEQVPVGVAAGAAGVAGEAEAETRPATTEPQGAPGQRNSPAAEPHETLPPVFVNGMAPLSDPVQSAQAIKLSDRVNPDLAFGSAPRRPPAPNYTHWTRRPEVRVGFTLGPLLTLLAWRKVRSRRREGRPAEPDEQTFVAPERKRSTTPRSSRQPPRGPGDRRRNDRRRN